MADDLRALREKVRSPHATQRDIMALLRRAYELTCNDGIDRKTVLEIVDEIQRADERSKKPWERPALFTIGKRLR